MMAHAYHLKSTLAPIALFTFNRPRHTATTIEALSRNRLADQSDLIVFSDGPKRPDQEPAVAQVRELIGNIKGFKSVRIICSDLNRGLARSIISGIDGIIQHAGRVIVLEDDVLTGPGFLEYMNRALSHYEAHSSVWSVSGYGPPIKWPADCDMSVYLAPRSGSWGWGTWLDRWVLVDWEIADFREFSSNGALRKEFNRGGNDLSYMLSLQMQGRIDSWAIRWCYNQFRNGRFTLFPRYSLTQNFGFDGSGTHCGDNDAPLRSLETMPAPLLSDNVILDPRIQRAFQKFHDYPLERWPRVLASRTKSYLRTKGLISSLT